MFSVIQSTTFPSLCYYSHPILFHTAVFEPCFYGCNSLTLLDRITSFSAKMIQLVTFSPTLIHYLSPSILFQRVLNIQTKTFWRYTADLSHTSSQLELQLVKLQFTFWLLFVLVVIARSIFILSGQF